MIENLLKLVKEQVTTTIQQHPEIPVEKTESIVKETSSSLVSGLQSGMAQGGIQEIMALFNNPEGNTGGNTVIQSIINTLIPSLVQKAGLSETAAQGFSNQLIPNLLGSLFNKIKDPNDNSFNIQDIMAQFMGGGQGGGLQSMLNKFLDKDGDGDTDLNDITKMLGGNKKDGDNDSGMMDMVKGLFGK